MLQLHHSTIPVLRLHRGEWEEGGMCELHEWIRLTSSVLTLSQTALGLSLARRGKSCPVVRSCLPGKQPSQRCSHGDYPTKLGQLMLAWIVG